jgi:hypothetical protein
MVLIPIQFFTFNNRTLLETNMDVFGEESVYINHGPLYESEVVIISISAILLWMRVLEHMKVLTVTGRLLPFLLSYSLLVPCRRNSLFFVRYFESY